MSLTPRKQVQQLLQELQARTINAFQASSQLAGLGLLIVSPAYLSGNNSYYRVAQDFASGILSFNDVYTVLGV